jgi:hypothetical protein
VRGSPTRSIPVAPQRLSAAELAHREIDDRNCGGEIEQHWLRRRGRSRIRMSGKHRTAHLSDGRTTATGAERETQGEKMKELFHLHRC